MKESMKEKMKAPAENVVYVGKTIPGVVTNGQVFANGIPMKLQQMKEKNPVVGAMIVPLGEFAKARKEIRKKGSALNTLYSQM